MRIDFRKCSCCALILAYITGCCENLLRTGLIGFAQSLCSHRKIITPTTITCVQTDIVIWLYKKPPFLALVYSNQNFPVKTHH